MSLAAHRYFIPPIHVSTTNCMNPYNNNNSSNNSSSNSSNNSNTNPPPLEHNTVITPSSSLGHSATFDEDILLSLDFMNTFGDVQNVLKCDIDDLVELQQQVSTSLTSAPASGVITATLTSVTTSTTTNALASSATTTTTTTTTAPAAVRRGGRTSQLTAKERRERHNANERRRTNAARDRIRTMRQTLIDLERERNELSARRSQELARAAEEEEKEVKTDDPSVSFKRLRLDSIESSYMKLIATVDRLREEKRYLEDQLDRFDTQNSGVQAILTEIDVNMSTDTGKRKHHAIDSDARAKKMMTTSVGATKVTNASESEYDDEDEGAFGHQTDEISPMYLKVLFDKPMSMDVAINWIKQSYEHVMAFQHEWKATAGTTNLLDSNMNSRVAFGWRPVSEVKADAFTQDFPSVLSGEFVAKTWNLLTSLQGIRLLHPRVKDFKILQRVNGDCIVVQVSIATSDSKGNDDEDKLVHSIVVIARGRIDGGYLISCRSIPLSVGLSEFAQNEGTYVNVFRWFLFLDKFDKDDLPVCEVTIGGRPVAVRPTVVKREDPPQHDETIEVLATLVRWQGAVGHGGWAIEGDDNAEHTAWAQKIE